MRKLTTKQRLSIIFGSYVFTFIVIIAIAVYYLFHAVIISEIKSQSVYVANEIIKNFISINKGVLVLDQKEETNLEEELLETNSSALLFNSSLDTIVGYGNFSFFKTQDSDSAKIIISLAKSSQATKKLKHTQMIWRDQRLLITAVPVLNGSELFGIIIIGKPISSISQMNNTIFLAFIILAITSFIGSVMLGNIIVRNALSPLQELTKTIHTIDLDKLKVVTPIQGSPHDEIVQLMNKFNAMVARIQGMSEQQKEFISNASHELKTPITNIASSLEILAIESPEHKETITSIQQSVFSLNTLLDQLMQLSKLQSGIAPTHEKSPIFTLLSSIEKQYEDEISKRELTIHSDIPKEETIPIPKEYASVLFSNILSNSIKYAKPSTPILISCSKTDTHVTIQFRNEGSGMTKAEISHVFDKFYRSQDAKLKARGYGIGLSIVQRICEIYHIDIRIESEKLSHTSVFLTYESA